MPILDHGAYVMLGNDELLLRMLAERRRTSSASATTSAGRSTPAKAMGVKVVNPGGISAFKFNQRKLDVDERARALAGHAAPGGAHAGAGAARAGRAASAAHPRQQPRRGRQHRSPRWRRSTRSKACRAHLTHVQFHATAPKGRSKFSSAALQLAEAVNAQPERLASTSARSCSARPSPRRATRCASMRNADLASPRKWIGADIECDAGCGVVPFRYREQSYVNALQWAIGLEIFLLVQRPVARGADHRPPQRRPVHQLPAPDPPADGQVVPRRAAGAAAPRRGGAQRRCARSRASSRSTRSRS